MDTMIVNVALPTITADLGGNMALQQWMIDGYTLLLASLLLLAGSLSDKFGAKRMFFFGTALFGAASLLSTFAWTMLVLIVGRCLMGVAAALILPASMALINEANPDPRRRAFALGLWGAGSASASTFGPLFGGLLTPIHWNLIFAVNVPFCLIVLALAPKVAPSPTRAISFDWLGQTLGGALVTPALSGLVLVSVEQKQAGIVSAVFNTFRQVGGAIGVAMFGVVATFTPSLDGSLLAVFIAAALLLICAFVYARLRWAER